MSLHGAVSPPRRKHHNNISPRKTLRYDAFQDSSSTGRSSIDRKRRVPPPVVASDLSDNRNKRETFLEDISPAEGIRHRDDGEDPHDLSFSPKHVPRASMVDSMVLSLDQFSNSSSGYAKYRDPNSHYASSSKPSRRRDHTTSSSVGSEKEARDHLAAPKLSKFTPRDERRNSTAKYQDTNKIPGIFGEDEDSVRVRVYNSQRAEAPPKVTRRRQAHNNNRPGSKGSTSSVDLGHLSALAGRLGPAGNRRSQSFDFGSRRSRDLRTTASEIDIAPTPVVFAGPEAQRRPNSPPFNSPQISRKNSTRSSKSAYGRKSRVGTLGTSTTRGKGEDPVPDMPSMKLSSLPPLPALDQVSSFAPLGDGAGPRPGFFRRVFGGSSRGLPITSTSSPAPSTIALPRRDRDPIILENDIRSLTPPIRLPPHPIPRESTDTTGKENFSTITKKSSAFFRRRKKSVSGNVPPPMPLTLNDTLTVVEKSGEVSPVSSLRAFMNPYLDDGQHAHPTPQFLREDARPDSSPTYHTAHGTPQLGSDAQFETSRTTRNSSERDTPKLQIPNAKGSSMLQTRQQDSFLVDSSSTDEPTKKSSYGTPSPSSDRPKTSPINRSYQKNVSSQRPDPLTTAESNLNSRPSIPPRQESWKKAKKPSPLPSIIGLTVPHEEKVTGSPGFSLPLEGAKQSPHRTDSDVSVYKSAPSTPLFIQPNGAEDKKLRSPVFHITHPSVSENKSQLDKVQAQRIFDNQDEDVDPENASAWLGEAGSERERVRKEYMQLFDLTGLNILAALRALCDRIALRGETQQVDRMLDAFAQRWCECNSNHGFKSGDVVHTICYSVLLLNTDLHLADIGQKMTRNQFVRNALPTIKRVAAEADANETIRGSSPFNRTPTPGSDHRARRPSVEDDSAAFPNIGRSAEEPIREDGGDAEPTVHSLGGPLVDAPFTGTDKAWDGQIETVLKAFYASISRQRLPLFGAPAELSVQSQPSGSLLSMTGNMLRRTPSTLSKAPSDTFRGRATMDNKSIGSRWASKTRSRPRLGPNVGFGSSRTSLDDQSSAWSPSMSSTWSKASLGKTLTSMSVDSFGSDGLRGDYQSSIGFANALSQAIIRDDQLEILLDDGPKAGALLEDESLELCGAPWAKEGIVKHKCHLDGVDKRSKDRNWNDCFAVIEKGWVRLFSFSVNAKSIRQKAKNHKAGAVVGGGNWQDNAEEVFKFMLRHTIASTLPPPGYSKARPYVWALSLPTGAVHLFSAGTPDIVKEFVSTANYWSARLSKEPMMGGVSNMEYGWSDQVINRALASDSASLLNRGPASPRPSTQISMRSSFDQGPGMRPKLPGDKLYINDWSPPQQSMMASQLMQVDQLRNLQAYVKNVEEDLQKHNELRPAMMVAFSARQPNSSKAMNNFEKKSAYLLREIVKFRTYIDILQTAKAQQQKIYSMRKDDDENRRKEDDARAVGASMQLEGSVL